MAAFVFPLGFFFLQGVNVVVCFCFDFFFFFFFWGEEECLQCTMYLFFYTLSCSLIKECVLASPRLFFRNDPCHCCKPETKETHIYHNFVLRIT